MKNWITVVGLITVLAACQGDGIETGHASTSLQDLQHHRWVLQRIDGLDLAAYAASLGFDQADLARKIPELDFGELGHVSGNTGCNQIQGKASVADNTLTLGPLASTRMACAGFAGELELWLSMLYAGPLAISREGTMLILTGDDTKLTFQLKDWVE